jgi:hypothetical protein
MNVIDDAKKWLGTADDDLQAVPHGHMLALELLQTFAWP